MSSILRCRNTNKSKTFFFVLIIALDSFQVTVSLCDSVLQSAADILSDTMYRTYDRTVNGITLLKMCPAT